MMIRLLSSLACLALFLFGLWLSSSVRASDEAEVRDLAVKVADGRILASFRLDNAFDEELIRRIDSGLPTDLVYRFSLERDRRSWFDASEAAGRLQVIAMYNAVTSEYLVNFKHNGNLVESRIVREQEELRKAMTEMVDFPVFSTEGLDPEVRLQLEVRAELGTKTLLAFIPRTRATDWAKSVLFTLARSEG